MQPAMLADSAMVTAAADCRWPAMQPVARHPRQRHLLAGAASRRGRRRRATAAVEQTLTAIVRDHNESESLRRSALSTLGSLDRGEGVPLLIAFAGGSATAGSPAPHSRSLANSGDPRARQFLRDAVRRQPTFR